MNELSFITRTHTIQVDKHEAQDGGMMNGNSKKIFTHFSVRKKRNDERHTFRRTIHGTVLLLCNVHGDEFCRWRLLRRSLLYHDIIYCITYFLCIGQSV